MAGDVITEPLALSIKDAGAALGGICRSHVYNMVNRGELELRKIGGRSVITMASVRRCLEAEAA